MFPPTTYLVVVSTPGTSPKSNYGRLFRAAGRKIRRHAKRQRDEEDAPIPAVRLGQHDTVRWKQYTRHHLTSIGHFVGQLCTSDASNDTVCSHNDYSDAAESAAATESFPGHISRRNFHAVPPPPNGNAHNTFRYVKRENDS